MLTAPSWSADPATLIHRTFDATHSHQDRVDLLATVGALEPLLTRHQPTKAVDHLLASYGPFEDRVNGYAAVSSLNSLGLLQVPLTWPGWAHPDGTSKRLLRPLEFALARYVSLRSPVAASEFALLEAGAASAELAQVTAADLKRNEAGQVVVSLPGTALTAPRTVGLGDWATASVIQLTLKRPQGLLLYGGRSTDPAKQESAVLMSVRKTLTKAGLGADRSVAPESIRNSGARAIYDRAPTETRLEAAAAALGIDNLDRVADRIGRRPTSATAATVVWPLPVY